jgi:hypothetical protein
MADKQVQIRKGNTAANDVFTGALGELSCDTQQNRLRVHDGATPGGFPHALKSEVDSKQPLLGFTPENVVNKAVDFSVLNNTLYPTTQAVSNFVATGVGGGFYPYRAVVSADTFSSSDYTIDAVGTFTLGLPTAVGITGRVYVAKNSGVGSIILDPFGAELIDSLPTATIVSGAALMVQSTGTGWIII